MDTFLKLLFEIPAAVTASVMIVNVLPFAVDKKLNPWVMFFAALLVLVLPQTIVLAMAMALPMAFIYGWTGVRLQGHEPVHVPVDQILTWVRSKIPRRSPPTEVHDFLTREFPVPNVEKHVPPL